MEAFVYGRTLANLPDASAVGNHIDSAIRQLAIKSGAAYVESGKVNREWRVDMDGLVLTAYFDSAAWTGRV